MRAMILPLLGPLHLRHPAWNAMTVRDLAAAFRPDAAVITPLVPGALEDPSWRDTPEVALPLAVLPWLERERIGFVLAGEEAADPSAPADFVRYSAQYPALQRALGPATAARRELEEALARPLTPSLLRTGVLPLVTKVQEELRAVAGDGPATGWVRERAARAAERALTGLGAFPRRDGDPLRVVVFAELELVPGLTEALASEAGLELAALPDSVPVSEEARTRSLLDHAMTGEWQAPEALLDALERLGTAEAGFARANVLVATGHQEQALAVLEQVSHGDFSEPYYLPGYLLARLGQLRDLAGRRDEALKAYRAVRALSYAPAEALEAAVAGLAEPFAGHEPE